MGPLPMTPRGKQYMLIVTDLFMKWVEAFSLIDTTATTLATTLMNEVCCYGVPASLHSDQGANHVVLLFKNYVNYLESIILEHLHNTLRAMDKLNN